MLYTAVVEEIRKTHCNGCQRFDNCTNCETLNCWLRHTYLKNGTWEAACNLDMFNEYAKNVSNKHKTEDENTN